VNATKGVGPDLCGDIGGARKIAVNTGECDTATSKPSSKDTQVLRAELIGSTICISAGVTVEGAAPVLALCRQLLANGLDADRALEVYRRGVLALRIRSITEAAVLEINAKGTDFVRRAVRTASPSELNLNKRAGIPSIGK
jgi:hypothetical protein